MFDSELDTSFHEIGFGTRVELRVALGIFSTPEKFFQVIAVAALGWSKRTSFSVGHGVIIHCFGFCSVIILRNGCADGGEVAAEIT